MCGTTTRAGLGAFVAKNGKPAQAAAGGAASAPSAAPAAASTTGPDREAAEADPNRRRLLRPRSQGGATLLGG